MIYILFVLGFAILIFGANILVDGASSLGRKMNMSSIVIGFTIVALGTSLPELIINIFASARGETDLAITNVLGSNIMNTLFIIGIAAFIFPIIPGKRTFYSLVPLSLFAAFVLLFFAKTSLFSANNVKIIDFGEGIILVLMIFLYLIFSYRFSKSETGTESNEIKEFTVLRSVAMILIGVAGLYFGGNWVVDGAVVIAGNFGMSRALVGITIVAVATSLPELITSMIAAMKKNSGIALGNALGSNIFNIFLVLGLSAIIRPLPFDNLLNIDVAVMILSNVVIAFFVYFGPGRKITKSEGVFIMIFYVVYIVTLVMRN